MLARSAGLELGETGGVACGADLATSAAGVWAAGDMCEYDSELHGRRVRIEHFEVAKAQGEAAAAAMLGERRPFREVPYFWTDLADWATAEWVGPERGRGARDRARLARRRRVQRAPPRAAAASSARSPSAVATTWPTRGG